MIRLAVVSAYTDEETAGLRLLEQAGEVAPTLTGNHAEALEYLRATLLIGAGVNCFNAGDGQAANENYSEAIAVVLRVDLPDQAVDLLTRVRDVVTQVARGKLSGQGAGIALAAQLAPQASRLAARPVIGFLAAVLVLAPL